MDEPLTEKRYLRLSKEASLEILSLVEDRKKRYSELSREIEQKTSVSISTDTLRRVISGRSRSRAQTIRAVLDYFELTFDDQNLEDPLTDQSIQASTDTNIVISEGSHVNLSKPAGYLSGAVNDLYKATTEDVQAIASAQIKILDSYHKEVLTQAKNSFRWALLASSVGFLFFLTAVVFSVYRNPKNQAFIPLVSGAIIEVIAGVNFYLYGKATQQLSSFHRKLDQTQRFLLANSICESLDGEAKQITRSELVKTVSTLAE